MGGSRQRFELFLGQPGIGNCQEILVELGLAAEVPISQNMIGKRRNLGRGGEVSEGQQGESKSSWEREGDTKVYTTAKGLLSAVPLRGRSRPLI